LSYLWQLNLETTKKRRKDPFDTPQTPQKLELDFRAQIELSQSRLTPVAGSDLIEEKVSRFSKLSQYSNSEELFKSNTSNFVKWTKLITTDCSFKFLAFYYTSSSGAFPGTFLFRKEPFKSNIWEIYESTPQPQEMNTVKRISQDLRFPRFEISHQEFGKRSFFPPSTFDPATGVKVGSTRKKMGNK